MFYKLIDEKNYIFGSEVLSAEYQLLTEDKDTYAYPVDGWYWFNSEEEAREFFNLPPLEIV